VTEGDDARPGEGRDVDDDVGPEAGRIRERVGEDDPPLGIGVVDLHGDARVQPQDVARPHRRPGGQVLDQRQERHHPQTGPPLRHAAHRGDHCRRPGHVVLHRCHVGGRLERDAAGIERHALADEHDGGARSRRAVLE
jgi:hypothetical protein